MRAHCRRIDADAGIIHRKAQRYRIPFALRQRHLDEDFAALGEFYCVADEIDQNLAQAHRITDQSRGDIFGDEMDELEAFLRAAF